MNKTMNCRRTLITMLRGIAFAGTFPAAAWPAVFTVTSTADAGPCSLRQAILDANASPGPDDIRFAISGSGVQTIQPLSPLPTMKEQTHVDGYTQPGARLNTRADTDDAVLLIELDGRFAGPADGLTVRFVGGTVRGLIINRFDGNGIRMQPDVSGRLAFLNVIEGNFIGTDPSGTLAAPNALAGVRLEEVSGNVIGRGPLWSRNIISSNGGAGVLVLGGRDNRIFGNFVGLDAFGRSVLANAGDGVNLSKSSDNRVSANAIQGNGGAGVSIVSGTGNSVLSNAIDGNGGLGIDLGADGPTPNDPCDVDSGPNEQQNAPRLTRFTGAAGDGVKIELDVCPASRTSYSLQLFASPSCDPTGGGEGRTMFAFFAWAFGPGLPSTVAWSTASVAPGQFLTATATDPAGNTSEFSNCVLVP
jgi:parallel beta-helix repeat protein